MHDDQNDPMEPLRRDVHAAFQNAVRMDRRLFQAMYRIDTTAYSPTGRTIHRFGHEILPPAKTLEIGFFEPGKGYYLVHFNDDGEILTDTFHETLDSAFFQAQREFSVPRDAWTRLE